MKLNWGYLLQLAGCFLLLTAVLYANNITKLEIILGVGCLVVGRLVRERNKV